MPAPLRNTKIVTALSLQCVLYARVSSKDQEKEGYSIPAQLKLLREYASKNNLRIMMEYVDVETAKRAGREQFGHMVKYLKAHPKMCQTIIVEKTDRLMRNFKDHVTLEDLGVTMHFVKENVIIGPDSKSAEKFVFNIKVACSRQYCDNLSEETKKGQQQKALSGIWPSFTPAGYQNVEGTNGKRTITPEPSEAPIIAELYNLFASEKYSLEALVQLARDRGMTLRGKRLQKSTLHQILRKRIYSGDFDFDGTTYQGTYEAIVTKDVWDSVQRILDKRKEHQTKASKRRFPFSGLITCGKCGCAMVAELKTKKKTKKTYVYYHCTGNRGKCGDPFTRQETLTHEFASTLGELVIPTEILDWLSQELNNTDLNEQGAREGTIKKLESERSRINRHLSTLYDDKLDGRITNQLWEEKSQTLQRQAEEIEHKLSQAQATALVPLTTALDIARMTSNACNQFLEQNEQEQRQLLMTILKEATWQEGGLRTTLLEPFEQLRRSNQLSTTKDNGNGGSGRDLKIWLPRQDSNSHSPHPQPALKIGHPHSTHQPDAASPRASDRVCLPSPASTLLGAKN